MGGSLVARSRGVVGRILNTWFYTNDLQGEWESSL